MMLIYNIKLFYIVEMQQIPIKMQFSCNYCLFFFSFCRIFNKERIKVNFEVNLWKMDLRLAKIQFQKLTRRKDSLLSVRMIPFWQICAMAKIRMTRKKLLIVFIIFTILVPAGYVIFYRHYVMVRGNQSVTQQYQEMVDDNQTPGLFE